MAHDNRVIDQFTQQAEVYRQLTSSLPGDRSAALRAMLGVTAQDEVLDLCCGPATMTLDLAPHVAHATGLDLTPAMLEQARIGQAERGLTNIDWVTGHVLALPFADGAFSLILCGAAFHHLTEPARAFAEMVRVCRPGGRIMVRDVTPSPGTSAEYDRIERLRDPSHVHALLLEELRDLGAGLPVGAPDITTHVTADLPFDAILATSFPDACKRDELLALMRDDAEEGEDRLGFSARLIEGRVHVSYPMTTAIWARLS